MRGTKETPIYQLCSQTPCLTQLTAYDNHVEVEVAK